MLLNESVRSVLVCVARATYSPRRLFRCGLTGGGWRWQPMRARYSVLARARERQRPFSTNLPHPYVEHLAPHLTSATKSATAAAASPIPAAPRRRIKSRSTRFLLAERAAAVAVATLLSPPRSLLSLRFTFLYKIIIILCTETTATVNDDNHDNINIMEFLFLFIHSLFCSL